MKIYRVTISNDREMYSWLEEYDGSEEILQTGDWKEPFPEDSSAVEILEALADGANCPPVFYGHPPNSCKIEELTRSPLCIKQLVED